MNDALFAAGIAILSSLGIAIVGYLYQIHRDKEHRKWQLEDKKYQRRLDVLAVRLKEAEDFTNKWSNMADLIFKNQQSLLISQQENSNFDQELTLLLTSTNITQSSLLNLYDDELTNLSTELLNSVIEEHKNIMSIKRKINTNEEFDRIAEGKRGFEAISKIRNLRKKIIQRIDHLAGFQVN